MWAGILDLLLPKRCCGCRAQPVESAFCADCSLLVERLPPWTCFQCAGLLPAFVPAKPRATQRCGKCEEAPPPYRQVLAPFVYGGPIATAIRRLKYQGARELARALGPALVQAGGLALEGSDRVVPLPLHRARLRERGYDQALLLAAQVARGAGLPLARRLLARTRPTQQQVGHDRSERAENLLRAFRASPEVEGLRLLLVDDVVTTGATARAASAALLAAGAREVRVLALARAL